MILEIAYTTGKSWATLSTYISEYKCADQRAIDRVAEMLDRHPFMQLAEVKYRVVDFNSDLQLSWQVLDLDKVMG